jgi:ribosomal protein S18 acetylase RimI-like enzyme
MGFWKNIFGGSGGTLTAKAKASGTQVGSPHHDSIDLLTVDQERDVRIFFSTTYTIDLYELEELCHSVGWSRRPLRKVKKALQNSFLVVSLWEQKGTRERLIGFSRATSDHAFNATIWDVVVRPSFQGKGLGKALMKYTIQKLRSADISNITLFADPHVIDFYRSIGFSPDPEGIKGMFWYPD